jgi:hypothetical protein
MKILGILTKDVRHLWPRILLFWLLLVLSAWLDPIYSRLPLAENFDYVASAFVLACATLIVAVIQQEALPGDRQYWLTRPIDSRTLWVAKAAFVFLSVDLPVVAVQAITLAVLGIPPGDHLGALLWHQMFFIAFLILPAAVLGSVTRNLGQAFLIGFLIMAFIVAVLLGMALANLIGLVIPVPIGVWELLDASLAAVGAAAVLWLQYARRATAIAGAVALATILICFTALMFDPTAAEPRRLTLSLDPQPAAAPTGPPAPLGSLEFPIRIEGVPAGVDIAVDRMQAGISGPRDSRGELFKTLTASIHDFSAGRGWLTVHNGMQEFGEASLYDPVHLYASLDLVLSTRGADFPLPGKAGIVVPAIGRCTEEDLKLVCYSPLPRTTLAVQSTNGVRQWIILPSSVGSLSPANALGFRALDSYTVWMPAFAGARLVTNIVARPSASLDFQPIRMSDYLPRH